MTTQSLTRSTEYHYWPSDIWSNQWSKNWREIPFLLTQQPILNLSHSFFAVEDSALMLLIFVIYHSVFAQINYWGHRTGDKLFSADIYLYSICVGSGRVRGHSLRSKPRVWDAGVAGLTVWRETHGSMSGCEGRSWHCRGRTTTESSARLSHAAVTALQSWAREGQGWHRENGNSSPAHQASPGQGRITNNWGSSVGQNMLPFPEHIQPRNTPDMLAVAAMCFHRSRQVSPRSWRMRCLVPSTCAGGVAGGHAAVSLISPAGCGCTAHSFQLEINLNLLWSLSSNSHLARHRWGPRPPECLLVYSPLLGLSLYQHRVLSK